MFKIKKIDSYIFKRFFTLFLMTFLICIFILLMQFLWKHIAELVGKGVSLSVLAEFFLYATFTLVPMALPLAILLASLMTFGNLGENFELTAMKSAGISLFRIMRPLILFISLVCVGAFYFSNDVLPKSQKKLWALIFSLKEKSPEFDIRVGEFSHEIPNVNLYIRGKKNHVLKDLMIYNFSEGFENAAVTLADSGRIQFTGDNKYLVLSLYNGESFENLKDQKISNSPTSIPYRRETFKSKIMLIDFNTKFNRFDESILQDQHVSKNLQQLTHSIDSVSKVTKSIMGFQSKEMVNKHFFGRDQAIGQNLNDSLKKNRTQLNADSLFLMMNQQSMVNASSSALESAKRVQQTIEYNKTSLSLTLGYQLRHEIERHTRFTLSFACLIFFFIGAPLGAIIRKGGLGMPVVVSVIMFIFYYIIQNTGFKLARESIWPTFEGMWLSSAVLLPIGIFLTYKAAVDASLLNPEQYIKLMALVKEKLNKFKTNIK
jgi:lipopolysaccharide export system permease protein